MPDADDVPRPSPEAIGRARDFLLHSGAAAAPKPSATVMVLRDGPDGLETFMMRRPAAMAFAAGMHVFPGGVVDPADSRCAGLSDPVVVAAIRETFEETGLLLASGGPAADAAQLEADRLALIAHQTSLGSVLGRHGLVPRGDALHLWSRWVTPEYEPSRYDTRFFVAALLESGGTETVEARDLGGESDGAGWVTPTAALSAAAGGRWLLMPPTELTLRDLVPFRRAADVVAAAARRDVRPIRARIDLDADPPAFAFDTSDGD